MLNQANSIWIQHAMRHKYFNPDWWQTRKRWDTRTFSIYVINLRQHHENILETDRITFVVSLVCSIVMFSAYESWISFQTKDERWNSMLCRWKRSLSCSSFNIWFYKKVSFSMFWPFYFLINVTSSSYLFVVSLTFISKKNFTINSNESLNWLVSQNFPISSKTKKKTQVDRRNNGCISWEFTFTKGDACFTMHSLVELNAIGLLIDKSESLSFGSLFFMD